MMIHLIAQSGGVPSIFVVQQILAWLFDPKTAMGSVMAIVFLTLLYLVFPSIREALKSFLTSKEKNQEQDYEERDDFRKSYLDMKTKDQEQDYEEREDFRKWLLKRTDQLEEERSRRMERVEVENVSLRDRLGGLEKDMKVQIVRNEETQQRLRNLEWIFLGEICEELVERVNRQKEHIATRLRQVGQEELANVVKEEFEKLINDVREAFLIRNMERTQQIHHTLDQVHNEQES